jgi:hypothetical protein
MSLSLLLIAGLAFLGVVAGLFFFTRSGRDE